MTEEVHFGQLKEKGNKEAELETIKKTTINQMWLSELEALRTNYLEYKEERTRLMNGEESSKKKKVVSKGSSLVKKGVKKTLIISNEED
jgi:hypothetical protein